MNRLIAYNLKDFNSARYLVDCCEQFRGNFDTDIIFGRYTVDGCSILGVQSLVGHIVSVDPQTDDEDLIKDLATMLINNEKR